jgi:helix-turn-helix protein
MTSNVITLPARPATEPSDHDLLMRALAEIATLEVRVAEIEARTPKPPFSLPRGWIAPKQAQPLLGVSKATVYRLCKRGPLVSAKTDKGLRIDPASIEKLRQRQSHRARA